MKGLNYYFLFLIFILSFPVFAQTQKPKIFLSFPESFSANEEIEVSVSISGLKNVTYDLKISIEKEKVLSEIYNEKEQKWQSSLYYIKNLFSGPHFDGKFKLRLKKEYLNFEGEAEILVRVRETGKSNYLEYRDKIKILKPEIKEEKGAETAVEERESLAFLSQNFEKNFFSSPLLIAIFVAIFSGVTILILKLQLNSVKKEK